MLILPGNWPASVVAASADRDETVLSGAGGAIVHWYPSPASAAPMLAEPDQVAGELASCARRSASTPVRTCRTSRSR